MRRVTPLDSSGQDWLCWRALNRLRTEVGRAKTVMMRWGYLDDAQSVACDCGESHTMVHLHLLSCRLLDEAYTADELATVTDRAKAFERKGEKIMWRTRQKKMRKYGRLYWLRQSCQLCLLQLKGIVSCSTSLRCIRRIKVRAWMPALLQKTREEVLTEQCGGRRD